MSVADKLKNLFSRKSDDGPLESSTELSLNTPDGSLDPMATGSIETQHDSPLAAVMGDADSVGDDSIEPQTLEEAELISVPLLGRRPVVIHQRILGTLL